MPTLITHLGEMPVAEFLRDYWQKKPLLIRQAFSNLESIISADELAGLALEEDVNSRLVIETPPAAPSQSSNASQWKVVHGPVVEEDAFSQLPETHWSLLVQHVDSLDPGVNEFLQNFRFIPNWRLDDIMISYAADQGGVGPHFDYYDVFLVQAAGQRRWRVGQHCDAQSALIPNQPMKLLQHFETQADWIVEPGDLLYIPAQLAHWGEAIGESITYSVGFRAPSETEVLLDYAQEKASTVSEDQRYHDPDLVHTEIPGEIHPHAVAQLQQILLKHCSDTRSIARWLGEYSTSLKQDIQCMLEDVETETLRSESFHLSPYCRAAFFEVEAGLSVAEDQNALLFINGQSWQCSLTLARLLSSYSPVQYNGLIEADQNLVLELHEQSLLCLTDN